MFNNKIKSIQDVVEHQLCTGCGACSFVSHDAFPMYSTLNHGNRPKTVLSFTHETLEQKALGLCPGISLKHEPTNHDPDILQELKPDWGPVLEIWEGHSTDEKLRFQASSGGVTSALSIFCIEKKNMEAVLHTGKNPDNPIQNKTVISTKREEIIKNSGSRYSPASPCDSLSHIQKGKKPWVFVGKPCDIAAVNKAEQTLPDLKKNLGLKVGFFCAGTPSLQGSIKMLEKMGLSSQQPLHDLRYRGHGWPGLAYAKEISGKEKTLTYSQSWGEILQKFRPWRCHLCIDHTGEFSDISVGDPWYREIKEGEKGRSLILVRTKRGQKILREAIEHGYIEAIRVTATELIYSQPNLLSTRGSIWGRITALKLIGIPIPKYQNLPTFHLWTNHLTIKQKLQSILGTLKRVFTRKLYKKVKIDYLEKIIPASSKNKQDIL